MVLGAEVVDQGKSRVATEDTLDVDAPGVPLAVDARMVAPQADGDAPDLGGGGQRVGAFEQVVVNVARLGRPGG